jgi:hypothetical protein
MQGDPAATSTFTRRSLPGAVLIASALIVPGCASRPMRFGTPEVASKALIEALSATDPVELKKVLGSEVEVLLSSGDEVDTRLNIEGFLRSYQERHRLVRGDDGAMILVVGNTDWQLPIPLVKDERQNAWYFDTEAGKSKIILRRIQRNELSAINACQSIVEAQRVYVKKDRLGDGMLRYARKFLSDPGNNNGLYWKTIEGQDRSPLAALVGVATAEGYDPNAASAGSPLPFHGYYYRMLTAQGPAARGGAVDYLVGDDLIGGFGVVAYPAEYGVSGVRTYITNQEGMVYGRDLGSGTESAAKSMKAYDPGPGWTVFQTSE